ncbi:SPFH/Band 7/PHB domain protein, partial [bacterium]|nr:SPFH/Band 7/PHB domain protein [bacterium]
MGGYEWVFGIIAVVVLIAVIVLGKKGVFIVPQAKVAIIERLGKFQKVAQSGVNFVNPLWSKPKIINTEDYTPNRFLLDLAEKYVDLPSQEVITKDNVNVNVDSVIYYQIMDPVKAVYEIRGLDKGIELLAVTTTRN